LDRIENILKKTERLPDSLIYSSLLNYFGVFDYFVNVKVYRKYEKNWELFCHEKGSIVVIQPSYLLFVLRKTTINSSNISNTLGYSNTYFTPIENSFYFQRTKKDNNEEILNIYK
jgi:hypothetical protein